MAFASAPASKLAVQLPAPASSLAVPPPAASTAEAVDLSAGAGIFEDPGLAATRILHRFRCCHLRGIVLLLYPAYCVACFVVWNWMDVNMMDSIIPGVRPIVYAPSLMPGIIVLHAMICARSSKYRHERSVQARSGKYCTISDPRAGPAGHESGPPSGSCKFENRRIRGPDPRVSRKKLAGHGDPTHE